MPNKTIAPCPFCGETLVPTQDQDSFTHDRRAKGAKDCFIGWLVVCYPDFNDWNTRAAALNPNPPNKEP